MRCGNQDTCKAYKKYAQDNKGEFPLYKYDEIIEIAQSVSPSIYYCRAIGGQGCSEVRTINLLEKISAQTEGEKI